MSAGVLRFVAGSGMTVRLLCSECGKTAGYSAQLRAPESSWAVPLCGECAARLRAADRVVWIRSFRQPEPTP